MVSPKDCKTASLPFCEILSRLCLRFKEWWCSCKASKHVHERRRKYYRTRARYSLASWERSLAFNFMWSPATIDRCTMMTCCKSCCLPVRWTVIILIIRYVRIYDHRKTVGWLFSSGMLLLSRCPKRERTWSTSDAASCVGDPASFVEPKKTLVTNVWYIDFFFNFLSSWILQSLVQQILNSINVIRPTFPQHLSFWLRWYRICSGYTPVSFVS